MLQSLFILTGVTLFIMQYNPDAIFVYILFASPLLGGWIIEKSNWGKNIIDYFKLKRLIIRKQVPFRIRRMKKKLIHRR